MKSLFLPIIDSFNRHEVSYVIVGGVATVLHGYTRVTADIDFIIDLSEKNAKKAVEVVLSLGYKAKPPVDPLLFAKEAERRGWIEQKGLTVFSFVNPDNPLVIVDFFVSNPISFSELNSESLSIDIGGIDAKVCSIRHLIQLKEAAGRPQDLEDVKALKLIMGSADSE